MISSEENPLKKKGTVNELHWKEAFFVSFLFMAAAFLFPSLGVLSDDPGFSQINPHPMLVCVVLLTARYGLSTGLMTTLLCGCAYITVLFMYVAPPTPYHLLGGQYTMPLVLSLLAAVVIGTLVQGQLRRLWSQDAEIEELRKENEVLKLRQDELRDVNVELAEKVVDSASSLPALYRYAKALNVDDKEEMFQGLCNLLIDVVKAESVSVWEETPKGELLLRAKGGYLGAALPLSPNSALSHIAENEVFALHDLPEEKRQANMPFLLGRLRSDSRKNMNAFLCIESLPLERYNNETIRLFSVVVEWATSSLNSASNKSAAPVKAKGKKKKPTGEMFGTQEFTLSQVLSDADSILAQVGKASPEDVAHKAAGKKVSNSAGQSSDRMMTLDSSGAPAKPLGKLLAEIATYMEGQEEKSDA